MAWTANHKSPPTRAGTECCRGAIIGAANGAVLAAFGDASAPLSLLAAAGASMVGALIALLIWSASSSVPDEAIRPPPEV